MGKGTPWRDERQAVLDRKVDVRLPEQGNSNSHGARPVHLIITMIKWLRTSRLSIKNSLSVRGRQSTREGRPQETSNDLWGVEFVESLRSSYTGLYPQRWCPLLPS